MTMTEANKAALKKANDDATFPTTLVLAYDDAQLDDTPGKQMTILLSPELCRDYLPMDNFMQRTFEMSDARFADLKESFHAFMREVDLITDFSDEIPR